MDGRVVLGGREVAADKVTKRQGRKKGKKRRLRRLRVKMKQNVGGREGGNGGKKSRNIQVESYQGGT